MFMKPVNKSDLFVLLKKNKGEFGGFGVKRLGVFGSFVRGDENKISDVDILVEFEKEKKNYKNYLALSEYLEKMFNRKVDLVTLESLSPYIGPYILKEVEYATLSA